MACKQFAADNIEFLVNPTLMIPIYNKLALNVIFQQIYCRQRLWRDRAMNGKKSRKCINYHIQTHAFMRLHDYTRSIGQLYTQAELEIYISSCACTCACVYACAIQVKIYKCIYPRYLCSKFDVIYYNKFIFIDVKKIFDFTIFFFS